MGHGFGGGDNDDDGERTIVAMVISPLFASTVIEGSDLELGSDDCDEFFDRDVSECK